MAHRLYVDFVMTVLQQQYGITRELAAQRLLDAAEAYALLGEHPSESEVLSLAIELHRERMG